MAKKYLHEIDFMRVFFIFGVLLVHTLSIYKDQLDPSSAEFFSLAGLHASLHFTRMGFMFMTGIVLFLGYRHIKLDPWQFWRKRFLAVGIPYLFWNLIYLLGTNFSSYSNGFKLTGLFKDWILALIHGDLGYIYYVLVTMQLYLIFPAIKYILERFKNDHLIFFLLSLFFQILLSFFIKYQLPTIDTSHWPYLFSHYGVFVLTYQCYFLAGAIAAYHYEKISQLVTKHIKKIAALLTLMIPIMWGYYLFDRFILMMTDKQAKSVHQPLFIFYSFLVIAAALYLGLQYAKKRTRPSNQKFSAFISLGAKLSFGIYLIQPLPLLVVRFFLISALSENRFIFYFSIPFVTIFVFGSSMFLAYLFYHSSLLSYCIGRKPSSDPSFLDTLKGRSS